jgi:hypothetical protein
VYFGERVNGLAQQHWQAFATQDYFDEHGVFYNAVVSGPALVTLFTVLVGRSLVCGAPPARAIACCRAQALHALTNAHAHTRTHKLKRLVANTCMSGVPAAALWSAVPPPQVFYLREAANLMVLVKTKELKQRARERAQAERAEGKKAQ